MTNKKKSSNQNLLDTIQGISQVMASKHDGALSDDGKGERIEIGLNREVENPITMSRYMDGFGTKIQGEFLVVTYHAQILMTDVHSNKFKNNIEDMFDQIVKFIKKQYKNITKQTLGLKDQGEAKMRVETMSRVRTWVIAQKIYHITSAEVEEVGDQSKLDKAISNWLSLKTDKKPSNVKIKKSDNQKEK